MVGVQRDRHRRRGRFQLVLVSLLALLALIAAACGGDDDAASGSDGTEATDGTTDDGTDGTGDAGDSSDSAGEGDSAADSGDTDSGAADAMEPEYGGAIVVGLEGETGQGWNPATSQFAVSGHVVARAIFDPLTVEMPDGTVAPFLLESFTPSADFTEWTLTMRPGIVFHDDTPADGEALARHFEEVRKSTLLGSILRPLDTVTVVDDLSVSLTFTRPVADFPGWLTGQIGYLTAPSQYDDDESASNPVGTGPFTFVEWIPDTKLVVEKNPDYWRTDGEGRELPFLDSIEFRPIPDSATRKLALDSGDLDASIDNEAQDFADYQADYELTVEGEGYHNTSYLLLNTSKPPFDDVRVRRAVAMCTDRDLYNTLRWGVGDVASGPFSPGTPGYLEDAGFPAFDPDGGRDLLAEVGSLGTITLGTTNDNFNRDSTELIASMWGDCGIDVQIKQVDQGELITLAVTGDFEAFLWRNHNGFSLGLERVWWHSDYASGLALNFGRIQDATIDAALDVALTDPDPAAVQAAAEDINRAFGEQVYNIWFYWSNWLVAYGPELHDVGAITTPEGTPALPMIEGRVFFTEAWMSAG